MKFGVFSIGDFAGGEAASLPAGKYFASGGRDAACFISEMLMLCNFLSIAGPSVSMSGLKPISSFSGLRIVEDEAA